MSEEIRHQPPANHEGWPAIAVVLLNWNSYTETARCLESLFDITYPNLTIYVIDNASADDSANRLREDYRGIEFIQSEENKGFAGGCNIGIRAALNNDPQHIILLNNDTVVSDGVFRELVHTAETHKDVGIVGGVIRKLNSEDVWYAGGQFQKRLVRAINQKSIQADEPYETEHVVGALMCLRVDFLEDCGLLDETYFFSFEDTEICHRAKANGWRVLITPSAEIEHAVGASSGSGNAFRYYHNTINRLRFANKELAFWEQAIFYIYLVSSRLIRGIQWILRKNTRGRIKASVLAIRDYIHGREARKPSELQI